MPTLNQYEIVKQQCSAMRSIGCVASFEMQSQVNGNIPKIKIFFAKKTYCFSDPDWDVVSMQLAKLYMTIQDKINAKN